VPSERFRVPLPAEPASLVGRDADVGAIERLRDARLVTLVGSPGVGKTRVALRIAHRAAPHGWFCDLSPARDQAALCAAMAAGLGVPLRGDPIEALGHRIAALGPAVIVVDNFEQLVEHAQETLHRWLAAAPEARFVVTSRERLRLRAERVVELAPLSLHDDAVALFVQRVRAARPSWTPTAKEEPGIEALVTALDGHPLAIELAAARVDVLGVEGLLSRLPEHLELLSRGARDAADRHATLRDAIAWSWQLLDERQRRALACCAVFRGGFTVDAAEAVIGVGAVDLLQDLRDRSLLRTPDMGRFALYESIRAFAAEQLRTLDLADEAWDAHRDHLLAVAEEHVARFHREGGAIEQLVRERDNLLAIAERALQAHAADDATRAVLALGPVLATRGPARFHVELLERATAMRPHDARLLHARGLAYRAVGDIGRAEEDLKTALAQQPPPEIGVAIRKDLGVLLHGRRAMDDARACYEMALPLARQIGGRRIEGVLTGNLGALGHDLGHFEEATSLYADALNIFRQVGDRRLEGIFRTNLGVLEQEQGRSAQARRHYEDALALLQQAADYRFEAVTLGNLGWLEHEAGELERARAHHRLALELLQQVGPVRSEALAGARLGAAWAASGDIAEARDHFDRAERAVLGRDPLALQLVRLYRAFVDLAQGHEAAAIERLAAAQASRDGTPSLVEISDDARLVLRVVTQRLGSGVGPRLEVGSEAQWFRAPGGERQPLDKYNAARRILDELTRARLSRPGDGVSGEQLFAAGWPGVQIKPRSANNRLYVALAKLRKMGLKLLILRSASGYLLDPDTPVVRVGD